MAKLIPLTQGKFAIVDDEDYEWLLQYKWRFNGRYAQRSVSRKEGHRVVLMHREILRAPKGMETDHINGNRTDNRRANLRIVTTAQNQHNVGLSARNRSGYKGVSWFRRHKKWHAALHNFGHTIHLGFYDRAEDAALAYDRAARQLRGKYAKTNFPEGSSG